MKCYLYRIAEITLLLCSLERIPTEQTCCEILKKTNAHFLCVLLPSICCDAAVYLYGAKTLLCAHYEAALAAAYHLSATRGLPLYEYNIQYKEKPHLVLVDKNTKECKICADRYKQLLSKVDISNGKYSLFAEVMTTQESCLCIGVDEIAMLNTERLSEQIAALPKEFHLPCVIYERGLGCGVRFLPYSAAESPPTVSAYLAAQQARCRAFPLSLGNAVCRGASCLHFEILCRPQKVGTLEFELCP